MFVHLQIRSGYSLLNSSIQIEELIKKAKENNFTALALTDENVLYGVFPFYEQCLAAGIKPIIGMITTLENGDQLILLAKNQQGYHHLIKISSIIQLEMQAGISISQLKQYSAGLIAITSGVRTGKSVEKFLLQGQLEEAKKILQMYIEIFGIEDTYLSIQQHGLEEEEQMYELLLELSEELHIPLVLTNDVHYLESNDAIIHDCLTAIKNNTTIKPNLIGQQYYLKTSEQMHSILQDEEPFQNTLRIAGKCQFTMPTQKPELPKFHVPTNETNEQYIERLCLEGLIKKLGTVVDNYKERLQFELSVIRKMDYIDYFLIVADFMEFAHTQGILTGTGRGSAAGSLVSYALSITSVDPIEYDLLFERFLNPDRISMPDIDIDFPDHRRDEVIAYVAKKYGSAHVAQIITFGTLAARAALRDVGRAFGSTLTDSLTKQVPMKVGITLKEALAESKGLQRVIETSEEARKIYETALKIEGLPRHTSTHAAGVVMSKHPLVDIVPLQEGHEQVSLTQYPMDTLESLGLLKMDFLSLKNLTVLETILNSITKVERVKINVDSIRLDDKKTFRLLASGDTFGVFQLESAGVRRVLRNLKPTEFEDIVAVTSLHRPGPMEQIPTYIARKHGKERIVYTHPDLKPILEKTYGVIIYQEQIIKIASKLAGFSIGEADLLRRAVSKKKREDLLHERNHFVSGCKQNGYEETVADEIYDLIVQFANYGFNRSHAVAYAMIAYYLAYLKANYPLHFYKAVLTNSMGNELKIAQYIQEAKEKGITILPPSINKSFGAFHLEGENIRFGLLSIKHIGIASIKEIVHDRKQKPFKDFFDFCVRMAGKSVNRKVIESFIVAGCFDEFGVERSILFASIDIALNHGDLLGGFFEPKYSEATSWSTDELLQKEKEALGIYISSHPVQAYKMHGTTAISELHEGTKTFLLGVYIRKEKKIRTKKGEQMVFLNVSDKSGEIDAVLFPNVYRISKINVGEVVLLEGKVENRDNRLQLIVSKVIPVTLGGVESVYVKVNREQEQDGTLRQVQKILQSFRGAVPVFLYYEQSGKVVELAAHYFTSASEDCVTELKKLLGSGNVVLK